MAYAPMPPFNWAWFENNLTSHSPLGWLTKSTPKPSAKGTIALGTKPAEGGVWVVMGRWLRRRAGFELNGRSGGLNAGFEGLREGVFGCGEWGWLEEGKFNCGAAAEPCSVGLSNLTTNMPSPAISKSPRAITRVMRKRITAIMAYLRLEAYLGAIAQEDGGKVDTSADTGVGMGANAGANMGLVWVMGEQAK